MALRKNHITTLNPLRVITEKLKLLTYEMEELKVDFRKLNADDDKKGYYAEFKSIRSSEINYDKTYTEPSSRPTNLKDKFEQCLKESSERQEIQNEWIKKIMISTDLSLKNHDSSIKRLEQKVNHLAQLISTHKPKHTLIPKIETFGEKVTRRILKENKEPTTTHDKPIQQLQKVVSHEIIKLSAHYSNALQNKLPPKETDLGSFILPCTIRNHSMSNALADLGASISVMPYSLFKILELECLKPIKMTIEMADRSMQSPKRIKENVLVKISKFVFPVDFIILDIIKDENVPIILGRPMLATAHTKIDVYGKKISLGIGQDQVVFKINKKESLASISPICVIDEFNETQELDMNDEMKGDFESYLLPEYESQDIISLSPSKSAKINEDFSMTLCDPDKITSIGLEDFDNMWDDLDLGILTNVKAKTKFLKKGKRIHLHNPDNLQLSCKIRFVNFNPYFEPQTPFNLISRKAYNTIMKHKLMYSGINMMGLAKNLHVFIGSHQFLVDFIVLKNISEFVEKGLTEVLFGRPFKEQIGLVKDRVKETLWFKISNDKIMFHMPRAEKAFRELTVKQHNSMGPLLKIGDEDKKKGIRKPEQKIKGFYKGCLSLGNEYKYDQEVVDWIQGCINTGMT
ncbi:homeodomain-like protein [Tanacetum coccineum]